MLAILAGCGRPAKDTVATPAPSLRYSSVNVGTPPEEKPWITNVTFCDLDHDGLIDGLACDAAKNTVVWLRQGPKGQFTEITLASNLPAPVHVSAVDIDGDGDTDLLIACMGRVLPSNERIGSVVILENTGDNHFVPHTIIENTYRVTDVEAGDFNGRRPPRSRRGQVRLLRR